MSSIPNLFAKLLSLHVQNRFEYFDLISKVFVIALTLKMGFWKILVTLQELGI